ncbi:universal stress protein [uncultured Chryseobacterium sp.]|uniref:universal stress protein n=1 Tax=uncultured Chryseobacterium sp. TaxID=259322 RepID=UPI0025F09A2B|nr:universal stress protein [uncultured Chryseobacterium sp.]
MKDFISIKTILVATDFTTRSEQAVKVAVHMAQRHNARIILFYNFSSFYIIDRTGRQMVGQESIDENFKQVEHRLNLIKDHLRQQYNFTNCSTVIGNNTLIYSLNKTIDEESADLVITGASGRQGIKELILGSSSYQILTAANCSVLLVPEDSHQLNFKKILVPVRVLDKLHEKFDLSKLIAEKNKGTISLLGISPEQQFTDIRRAYIGLRKELRRSHIEYDSSFIVSNDKALEISKVSNDSEFDLIILNYQDEENWKSFFSENFLKRIINRTSVPLLFFKDSNQNNIKKDPEEDTGYDITLPFPG